MNPAVGTTFQYINNNWPIAEYTVEGDGSVVFTCDDGDSGTIDNTGKWDWDQ